MVILESNRIHRVKIFGAGCDFGRVFANYRASARGRSVLAASETGLIHNWREPKAIRRVRRRMGEFLPAFAVISEKMFFGPKLPLRQQCRMLKNAAIGRQ